jgi:hypothetical protein
MSLHALANDMASKGRGGDSLLVHMAPSEVAGLHALAQAHGENLTINPETGLPEAFNLKSLLPMIIGAGLTATGVGAPMAAAMVGAGYTAATGSLQKGLMAGIGAYGGAGLGAGLSAAAGAESAATGLTPSMTVQPMTFGASPDITAGMGEVAAQEGAGIAGTNIPTMGRSAAELADIGTAQRVFPGDYPQGAPFAQHSALTQPIPAGDSLAAQLQQKAIDEAALQAAPTTNPEAFYEPAQSAAQSAAPKDMSFTDRARQTASTYGEGIKKLSTEEGRKAFMGNAASKGVEATGVGGTSGLLKYAGAAALPAMQPDDNPPEKPAEGNIVDYSYDPISGKYRRLRSTPASQYKTMSAKNGGITSLLSFAEGGLTEAQLASVNAFLQTNPSPEELAAAQAQYGVSDADVARAREYGAVGSAPGSDIPNAPTGPVVGGGGYSKTTPSGGTKAQGYSRDYSGEELTAIRGTFAQYRDNPQKLMELMSQYGVSVDDLALAQGGDRKGYQNIFLQAGADPAFGGMSDYKATANDKAYIDYMLKQPNPLGQGTMADVYKAQGIDPYNDPRVISQARAENERALDRAKMYENVGLTAPKEQISPWTIGGGAGAGPGRTTGAGSGAGGTGGGTTGGVGSLPITNATIPAYAGTNSPTGGISSLQVLTPQGVMGGSERGGTVSNVSQIIPAYQQYWQNAPVGSTVDFAGGKLSRISGAQAVFTDKNGKTYSMGPTSDLNIIAAQNPAIGETWRTEFGMVPQNYMQGESARAYEFLRGNEPYSVNQQVKGIARPYGEMAMGLPGATFGSNAVINQQAINEATAKQKADPTNKGITIPTAQLGYGVTNPGTYNMKTVYDPNTGRYMENNMYTAPAEAAANAKAAAAIDPVAGGNPVNNTGSTDGGGEANGGLMALGGMTGNGRAEYNLGDYSDGGRLLRGPGDGVSDSIPATIGGKRQARLADGEFVVPARIVSELGNGSTEAGARQLYAMMDRIQKNRRRSVGKGKVAVNSKSSKFLPA